MISPRYPGQLWYNGGCFIGNTAMNTQDIRQIVAGLPTPLTGLGEAISIRIQEEFAGREVVPRFRFAIHEAIMTCQVYDHFRGTSWLINAGPDPFFGQGMQLAVIRRKTYVEPAPTFCFHATEAENKESIEKTGLLPGSRIGKIPRRNAFVDSVHYIFASLELKDATTWIDRLAERGDFLIYRVRIHGFCLIPDPCAGEIDGRPDGYILDTDRVPRTLLLDRFAIPRSQIGTPASE